jgi:WD40 repeat protein
MKPPFFPRAGRRFLLALSLFGLLAGCSGKKEGADAPTQARIDFLQAFILAQDGNKLQALHFLDESLQHQREGNLAADLAFQLLAETRTNSSLILRGPTEAVVRIAYSPDGTLLAAASRDNNARIWDVRTGKLLQTLPHENDVLMAEFNPDGTRLVTASDDETAVIWDVQTGRPLLTLKNIEEVRYARFSPDGTKVATADDTSTIFVWDAKSGEKILSHRYKNGAYGANFNADGSRLLTFTGDDCADLFDLKTGQPVAEPIKHGSGIYVASYSPDGSTILTASADATARLWDATTGKSLDRAFPHDFWVNYASFSPDGTKVATASADYTARVWDARTGQPVTPPLLHIGAVLYAFFSPDGRRVLTVSQDHTARVWNATSGAPVGLPVQNVAEGLTAVFSPDGRFLATALQDHTVRIWALPPVETAPEWLAPLARFASTQTLYAQTSKSAVPESIMQLREKLLASTSKDPWEAFGRWYFSEGDVRPVIPGSSLSLKNHVENLIAAGDRNSIEYAISLSQKQPSWMVRLVPMLLEVKRREAATGPESALLEKPPQKKGHSL